MAITGFIRAAASEEQAAATIRDLVARRLLLPLASRAELVAALAPVFDHYLTDRFDPT
jgi:hypothetical protein